MKSMKRQKYMTPEDDPHRLEGVQYASGEEQSTTTNSSRNNEAAGPKRKQHSVVDGFGDVSKIGCFKG